jgi:RimJ/RimL family protein N-acetyltransferase
MQVLETSRLVLRWVTTDDAPFIFELLNEPSFLQYIGDKGVRSLEDARNYILTGPVASYQRFGFGLYLVLLKESGTPIGMCGLLKRDSLTDVDVGYAYRPAFWSNGYAFEAASAVLAHGREVFGLRRIVAITSPDNAGSRALLEKLGLHYEGTLSLSPGQDTHLFAVEA